jgi:hypothetical protein
MTKKITVNIDMEEFFENEFNRDNSTEEIKHIICLGCKSQLHAIKVTDTGVYGVQCNRCKGIIK